MKTIKENGSLLTIKLRTKERSVISLLVSEFKIDINFVKVTKMCLTGAL